MLPRLCKFCSKPLNHDPRKRIYSTKRFCSRECTNKYRGRHTPEVRFWAFVYKTPDCWMWMGVPDKDGYGLLRINHKNVRAHHFSYRLHKGEISEGMLVCHSCDNPGCVNPDHLWAGTNGQNVIDCTLKGRSGRAKLQPEQVCAIRAAFANGALAKDLANTYNVTDTTIWRVVNRTRYSYVD